MDTVIHGRRYSVSALSLAEAAGDDAALMLRLLPRPGQSAFLPAFAAPNAGRAMRQSVAAHLSFLGETASLELCAQHGWTFEDFGIFLRCVFRLDAEEEPCGGAKDAKDAKGAKGAKGAENGQGAEERELLSDAECALDCGRLTCRGLRLRVAPIPLGELLAGETAYRLPVPEPDAPGRGLYAFLSEEHARQELERCLAAQVFCGGTPQSLDALAGAGFDLDDLGTLLLKLYAVSGIVDAHGHAHATKSTDDADRTGKARAPWTELMADLTRTGQSHREIMGHGLAYLLALREQLARKICLEHGVDPDRSRDDGVSDEELNARLMKQYR